MTAVDSDNSRRGTDKGSRDRNGFSLPDRLKLHQVREFTGNTIFGLDRFQPQGAGQRRSVDRVHFSASGFFQKSLQHVSRDWTCLELVDLAAVIDRKRLTAFRGDLPQKASELFAERKVRRNDAERLGIDIRDVNGVSNHALEQNRSDCLGNFYTHAFLRLRRGCAQVRREYDVGESS